MVDIYRFSYSKSVYLPGYDNYLMEYKTNISWDRYEFHA
jgi:hypothetical protein